MNEDYTDNEQERYFDEKESKIEKLQESVVAILLGEEASTQFQHGDISHHILAPYAQALIDLSKEYVRRTSYEAPSISNIRAKAYALYYTPINYEKVSYLLSLLPSTLFSHTPRVLDYGCGPGTASLALLSQLKGKAHIVAVDSFLAMREVAAQVVGKYREANQCNATWEIRSSIEKEERFDLIVGANVLNELHDKEASLLVEQWLSSLTKQGVLIIIEPALEEVTQRLMKMRDELLSHYPNVVPLYPCTRRDNCPMLQKDPEGWCHGTVYWDRPRLVQQLDTLTGFNKHRIKYSAFVFSHAHSLLPGYRVITEATKSQRGSKVTLCGPEVYGLTLLPKKNRADTNRTFSHLKQHERVEIFPPVEEGILQKSSIVMRPNGKD